MSAPSREQAGAEKGSPREHAEARATAPSERTPEALVAAVQRTAGNRAVLALLTRRRSARRALARRRVPSRGELEQILFDPGGGGLVHATDAGAHRDGLTRLIEMSRQEMSAADQARVTTERQRGLTNPQWAALSTSEQRIREAEAIVRVQPDALLGDPLLINSGPRPGTQDAAHITQLVNAANALFDRIATGAVDVHIDQVFGAAKRADAKAKYANARTRLNTLHASGMIVTDRSRYNAEAFLGGLTNPARISLAPGVIDHPTRRESIITCLHESMHAGNADVGDEGGYIDRRAEFIVASEDDKVHNAAHYEVVPRRMLGMGRAGFAYPGVTFTPGVLAPAVGVAPPPPPPPGPGPPPPVVSLKEQAIRAAYLHWKEAWTTALNLHNLFVRNLRTPGDWTTDISAEFGLAPGARFTDVLPFWSKVEGLTIHNRPGISAASADPSTQPVTRIDVALSEAAVRQLARGMFAMPETEAAANALEATAPAAEVAAANTVDKERDLLIKLSAQAVGTVTGTAARDVHVVNTLGPSNLSFPDMLKVRGPAAFPH